MITAKATFYFINTNQSAICVEYPNNPHEIFAAQESSRVKTPTRVKIEIPDDWKPDSVVRFEAWKRKCKGLLV